MLSIIIALIINTIIVFFAAYILPGVKLYKLIDAVIIAILLGICNAFIYHILMWMTLPTNFISYGILSLIICTVVILAVSYIMPGFEVDGFGGAFSFAILIAILNAIIHSLLH